MEVSLLRCLLVLAAAVVQLCTAQGSASSTTVNVTADPVWSDWTCSDDGVMTRYRTDVQRIIQTINQTTAETTYSADCMICGCFNPSNAVLRPDNTFTLFKQWGGIGYGAPGMASIGKLAYKLNTISNGSPIEHNITPYNVTTNFTSISPTIPILPTVACGAGITVCASCGYIYVADVRGKGIRRISSTNKTLVDNWTVNFTSTGMGSDCLTSDANCNIVAAGVGSASTLRVFTYDGKVIADVTLTGTGGVKVIMSAAKTPTGYVAAYTNTAGKPLVGLFNSNGVLLTNAVNVSFSQPAPTSVSVNGGYVLVADAKRIVMLDSSLRYVRTVVTVAAPANYMWLDAANALLYSVPAINPYSPVFINIFSIG